MDLNRKIFLIASAVLVLVLGCLETVYVMVNEGRPSGMITTFLLAAGTISTLVVVAVSLYFRRAVADKISILHNNAMRIQGGQEAEPIGDSSKLGQVDEYLRKLSDKQRTTARQLALTMQDLAQERSILQNAADVICSLDKDGRLVRISHASLRVLGYRPEELQEKWLIELVVQEDVPGTQANLKQSAQTSSVLNFENRVKRKDGLVIQLLWSICWSEVDQTFVCVGHEITERKNAEAALRNSEAKTRIILENVPAGIIITTNDHRIDLVSPSLEAMLGYSLAQLKQMTFVDLFVDNKNRPTSVFLRDLLAKQAGGVTRLQAKRGAGDLLPVDVAVVEFNDLDGSKIMAVMVDVTESFQLEKLKREFLALVTHELRTPLTSLQGFLAMLNKGVYGDLPEKAAQKAQSASISVNRLIALVNDILDLEKMEAGKFNFEFQEIDLTDAIQHSIDTVQPLAEAANLGFNVQVGDFCVVADYNRLVQVVVNLLSNAIKYSNPGTSINITATTKNEFVEVAIIDHGKGIPIEFVDTIFERFVQVPGSQDRSGGTGLGLPITKAIIDQHGGTIGLISEEGKGSRFWFRLKRAGS